MKKKKKAEARKKGRRKSTMVSYEKRVKIVR